MVTRDSAWYSADASQLTEAMHDASVNFNCVDGGAGAMARGDRPPVMDLLVFAEMRRAASKLTVRILNAFALCAPAKG